MNRNRRAGGKKKDLDVADLYKKVSGELHISEK